MKRYRNLWRAFITVIAASLGVLGYYGFEIYQKAPPVPARVMSTEGRVVFTHEQITTGQNAWQSIGGQQAGSIWGRGAYVAPDWSADWLHRELVWILDRWAKSEFKTAYEKLDEPAQAALRARLRKGIRAKTYNANSGDILISPVRAEAIQAVAAHYMALFGNDPERRKLRDAYAIPENALKDPARREAITALFGVYGMLGTGLMLFCLRGLTNRRGWKTGSVKSSFWMINAGLALMVLLSLLPVGLLQAWASVEHGMWFARSAEFLQTPLVQNLRWMRVIGDTVFAAGIVALGWFVLGLKTGWSLQAASDLNRPVKLPPIRRREVAELP